MSAVTVYNLFKAVTPDSTNDFPFGKCDALYIGGGGDISVMSLNTNNFQVFVGVPAGTILPVTTRRVGTSFTTATGIVALYDR